MGHDRRQWRLSLRARLCGCAALCAAGLALNCAISAATAQTPTGPPQPIAWRQRTFAIPFRVNPGESPTEVRLFMSVDGGRNWQLVGRQNPQHGSFTYRAAADGEYWFSLRTVDAQGRLSPAAPHHAELIVQVDTLAPRLQLSAARGPAGEVELRWQAVDPQLRVDSLKIEYQTSPGGPWRRMAIRQPTDSTARSTRIGKATWWPDEKTDRVALRAEVFDRAGNSAVSQASVDLNSAGAQIAGPIQAAPPGGTPAQPIATLDPPSQRLLPPAGVARPETGPQPSESPAPDSASPGSQSWPADEVSQRPLNSSLGHSDDSSHRATPPQNSSPSPRQQFFYPPQDNSPNNYGAQSPNNDQSPPNESQFIRLRQSPGVGPMRSAIPPVMQSQPAAAPLPARLVNMRSFELQYEVDAGNSGVAAVELWGTRDGGRTWALFGNDSDNESPLQVHVDREGAYGFRIVAQTATGLRGHRPQAGEPPDVAVTVDLTRPAAKLLAAGVIPGQSPEGAITIRWQAADPHLGPRPISISYAGDPFGEWTPIVANMENTGLFNWRPDDQAPDHCFIRIDVRDGAGNVTSQFTRSPVALVFRQPAARVRSVRPVEQTPPLEGPLEGPADTPDYEPIPRLEPSSTPTGPAVSPLQQPLDGPAFSSQRQPSGRRHRYR
jgi:hypothetical protein